MNRMAAIFLLALFICPAANALEVAGVSIPGEVRLNPGGERLQLNGAGIRKKFFFSIYVAALYLPRPTRDAQQIITMTVPKRVVMYVLYGEVSKERFVEGWNAGFSANLSEIALQQLRPRLDRFNDLFETLHKGDRVELDYLPGQGTRVTIKGEVRGIIPGEDFNQALLRIWLGDEPVTRSLKSALLGAG